ncbi:MAG: CGGC domain-containing protein [Thermodesulfovibrionales bacterium]|nr:CGGC domain-containing protein [Thermodesulfovibrionales bacterium]
MGNGKKRIAIFACKNIKGISCVGGCLKCFKGISERAGEYERWKDYDLEVAGMDDCGGCPGVLMPKVALMKDMARLYDRDFEAIHLGTCIVKAVQTAKCPIDLETIKGKLEAKFNAEVVLGTHPY